MLRPDADGGLRRWFGRLGLDRRRPPGLDRYRWHRLLAHHREFDEFFKDPKRVAKIIVILYRVLVSAEPRALTTPLIASSSSVSAFTSSLATS